MFFPTVLEDNNTLSLITQWFGYNHNYRIQNGQFYDMENLSSDHYPVLTPRDVRPALKRGENIRGILYSEDKLTWLDGDVLHYYESEYDLSDYVNTPGLSTHQNLLRFGGYILIMPENLYFNVVTGEIGRMDESVEAPRNITITYTMCKLDGSDYDNVTVSETAPANPNDGDYWLCTKADSKGLNVWYATKSMWEPVATTYIRIAIPGLDLSETFEEGDTVTLNSSVSDINDGSTIQKITSEYMVVIGILPDVVSMTEVTSAAWTLVIQRKIPKLDYVCVDKNRVWGCYYGYKGNELINEIYSSKLGDFKNWYTYSGIASDAYAATVGTPGQWTGAISYGGYPTFFKEDAIYRIYGSYPSEYVLLQDSCRGVQKGSDRSLAVVGEYLFYKSPSDVVVYDGSSPSSISEALGSDMYYDCVGGGCLNKYYLRAEDSKGLDYMFVYDVKNGIWEKESPLNAIGFSGSENGQLFVATSTEIIGLGSTNNYTYLSPLVGEEWTEWYATTGELGMEYADFKYVSRLTLRAYVPHRSEISIQISYDGKTFDDIGVVRGIGEVTSTSLQLAPYRCDNFRIKLSGHGECRIYSLAITFEAGSEDDNGYD